MFLVIIRTASASTFNEYHNVYLCGETGKIAILYGYIRSMYLAKYFSYLSMKIFFKRNASIGLSAISAKGGNLYHSGLIQRQ